jgi:GTPase Era involved in 16S rRNA processing
VLFDVSNLETLEAAIEWKEDVDAAVRMFEGKPIPCILLGNKIDVCKDGNWGKTEEEMSEFIAEHGFIDFMTISAVTGLNVEEAVKRLVRFVLDHDIQPPCPRNGPINIGMPEKEGGGCH